MAELEHEVVVRVLEPHGEDGGYHFFVMELLLGGDLRRAVLEKRVVGAAVLPIILRVGDALALAHGKRLVHRDVKPANVLLDEAGTPRLTDFDLVGGADTTGGTRSGAIGTVVYAAPELMHRPQEADARADVYGLAMTAVFGLRGEELPLEVVRDAEELIDQLSCGAAIKAVLKEAVEWKPARRFKDAGVFCKALEAAMVPAKAESWALEDPIEFPEEGAPGWLVFMMLFVAAVLAAYASGAAGVFSSQEPPTERAAADAGVDAAGVEDAGRASQGSGRAAADAGVDAAGVVDLPNPYR